MLAWLIIFVVCILIELYWRRGYFLWLALVAGFSALMLFQVACWLSISFFIIVGAAATVLWHLYVRRPMQAFERNVEERNPKKYLHHTFCLEYPIQQGKGKAFLDDSVWSLACNEDLPAETPVRVVKISGVVLQVIKYGIECR